MKDPVKSLIKLRMILDTKMKRPVRIDGGNLIMKTIDNY